MARMYSRKRGKSGSKKPIKKTIPVWMRYTPKEVELLIIRMAKDGKTASQIGLFLRDVYGVPNAKTVLGKSITQLLQEKHLLQKVPEDLAALMRRAILLKKHMEENKKDQTAKRGFSLTESKIRRLIKYYKSTEKLPQDWTFNLERMRLMVD